MLTDFTKKLIFASLLLWGGIVAMLIHGDRVSTAVEDFSLENKTVSPYTEQMIFEFNRSVDTEEMQKTFSIIPKPEFDVSWIRKKMVVTFKEALEEDQRYEVTLGTYESEFTVREKELFYIDSLGESRQVFSYNLNTSETGALTPEELLVTSYELSDDGNTMVFFGTPKSQIQENDDYSLFPNLYSLDLESGEVKLLLEDEEKTLNISFRLSPNGEIILLYQLHLTKDGAPDGTELLISENGGTFKPFWKQDLSGVTGDTIHFTGDSRFLVAYDWNRYKILPITKEAHPEQDLGDFVRIVGFNTAKNKLLFLQWKDDNPFALSNELVIFDETGGKEVVAEDLGVIDDAMVTQNGEYVVLILEEIGANDFGVYLFENFTKKLSRLDEENLYTEGGLDLSKDEEWLTYVSQLDATEESGGEIWAVNIKTKEKQMITTDGRSPKWRP